MKVLNSQEVIVVAGGIVELKGPTNGDYAIILGTAGNLWFSSFTRVVAKQVGLTGVALASVSPAITISGLVIGLCLYHTFVEEVPMVTAQVAG